MHASDPLPRFVVDGMALRLGKYLRCAGFDAVWDVAAETRALARRAELEGRVLLTRNTRLGEGVRPPPRWLALASDDPCEQFWQVMRELGLDPRARLFTRCILCNVELVSATAAQVEARVPEAVRSRYARFFACPSCATVFWHGSHVANTCRKLGLAPPDP